MNSVMKISKGILVISTKGYNGNFTRFLKYLDIFEKISRYFRLDTYLDLRSEFWSR